MDDAELIRRELRAAREELIRKQSQYSGGPEESTSRLPLMPEREEGFLRLALMSVDELEAHVERLERDLEDLEQGFDRPNG
jgi:polyhydroxyalkanoate synthesis regulator phasin